MNVTSNNPCSGLTQPQKQIFRFRWLWLSNHLVASFYLEWFFTGIWYCYHWICTCLFNIYNKIPMFRWECFFVQKWQIVAKIQTSINSSDIIHNNSYSNFQVNLILTLLMLGIWYSGFGDQYHTCWIYFMNSFLNTEMMWIVQILPRMKQRLVYPA